MNSVYKERDYIPYVVHRNLIYHKNNLLVAVYLFLKYHEIKYRNVAIFHLNEMIEWCGYKVNSDKGTSKDKFLEALQILQEMDYISCDCNLDSSKIKVTDKIVCNIDDDIVQYYIKQSVRSEEPGIFGIVYSSEIEKILQGSTNARNVDIPKHFLVLAYLRSLIYLRKDNKDDSSSPEAYANYYHIISAQLSITTKALSKSINVLCEDYNIINYTRLYLRLTPDSDKNSKSVDTKSKYITTQTVFVNRYKIAGSVLIEGEDYYSVEMVNKLMQVKNDALSYYSPKDIIKNSKKEDRLSGVECEHKTIETIETVEDYNMFMKNLR